MDVRAVVRGAARIALGGGLVFTGSAHFVVADTFRAQVPPWMPAPEAVIAISGVIELVLAAGLLFLPRYQVEFGWATAALLLAVFPGNISQYLTQSDAFGLDTDRGRFIRLFFQPLFIAWALWCTGAWRARRDGRGGHREATA